MNQQFERRRAHAGGREHGVDAGQHTRLRRRWRGQNLQGGLLVALLQNHIGEGAANIDGQANLRGHIRLAVVRRKRAERLTLYPH